MYRLFKEYFHKVLATTIFLATGSPMLASAATPTCVVKLSFSSDEKTDAGYGDNVKKILLDQGYTVINDGILTWWDASNYKVSLTITNTLLPNYGFPTTMISMDLYIADSSGAVLVNSAIDRSILDDVIRASLPTCEAK